MLSSAKGGKVLEWMDGVYIQPLDSAKDKVLGW